MNENEKWLENKRVLPSVTLQRRNRRLRICTASSRSAREAFLQMPLAPTTLQGKNNDQRASLRQGHVKQHD